MCTISAVFRKKYFLLVIASYVCLTGTVLFGSEEKKCDDETTHLLFDKLRGKTAARATSANSTLLIKFTETPDVTPSDTPDGTPNPSAEPDRQLPRYLVEEAIARARANRTEEDCHCCGVVLDMLKMCLSRVGARNAEDV